MKGVKVTEVVVNNFYRSLVDSKIPLRDILNRLRGFKEGIKFLGGFDQAGEVKVDSLIQNLSDTDESGASKPNQVDLFRYY